MAEVCGQRWKQTLQVRILSVPFGQPVNRECVSQIMKPRLKVRIVAALDACDSPQAREACSSNLGGNGITALRLKQWLIVLVSSPGKAKVLLEHLLDIRSERHEARLIEFRISYRNEGEHQIYIHESEPECFAEPHAGSVQKQQQSTECSCRHDTVRMLLASRHGVEERA